MHNLRNFKFILDDIFDEHMVFQTKVHCTWQNAQPYLVHFKIITVSAIPNRTFSLNSSMSPSGNWFMKVTGMPGVAIIAIIHP